MQKKIAVVIPCYRVEETIRQVIKKIPAIVNEIIVVNDHSPDGTVDAVKSCSDPRITLISLNRNMGVGGAMKVGYSYALKKRAEIVIKVDGDDQMDPEYIPMLIAPIENDEADYTKGNRFLHSQALKRMPIIRKIGNLGLTFLTKAASGYWNIFDPTNGYTAISSEMLRVLDPANISNNYFFETSMLCELRKNDAIVRDIPIPAIYNGEKSSLNPAKQLAIFWINLTRKTFSRLVYRYFLFDFTATSFYILSGIISLLFGFIWGIVKWSQSSAAGIPSTTGTVLIAVLPIILGVQFLVQAIAMDVADVPLVKKTSYSRIPANVGLEFGFDGYLSLIKNSVEFIDNQTSQ